MHRTYSIIPAGLLAACSGLWFAACLQTFPNSSLDPALLLLTGDSGGAASSSTSPPTTSGVSALYSGFSAWNDYVQNDGTTRLNATGTACTGSATGGYSSCIHAGLMRAVPISNRSSCTGLSATDSESAFVWGCDDSTGSVRMIALGLVPGRGLNNLIDFSAGAWKSMSVTVTDSAGSTTTEASQWWTNPIVLNHQPGAAIVLSTAGTVYAYSVSPGGDVQINADKIALVADQSFFWQGAAATGNMILATSANYLWIEPGSMSGTNQNVGIFLNGVLYSAVQLARIQRTNNHGIDLNNAHNCQVRFASVSSNLGGDGVFLNSSSNNTLSFLYLSNSPTNGLSIQNSNNNIVSNVLATNNGARGVLLNTAVNNALVNITATNNGTTGIDIGANSVQNSFGSLAVGNNPTGIDLDATAHQNSLAHTAAAHSGIGLNVNSTYNFFTGIFRVGNNTTDCAGGGTAGIGGSCTANSASNHTPQFGADFSAAFSGKIGSDDSVNSSDTTGAAAVGSILDWLHFASSFRLWGLQGSGAFPLASQRGNCNSGTCHIFDWRLSSSDSTLRNNLPVPDGNQTLVHIWTAANQTICESIDRAVWTTNVCSYPGYTTSSACTGAGGDWSSNKCVSVILSSSYELIGDGLGNENGLCESYEICVYSPNIGAYQGQGQGGLTDIGNITDGVVKGVRLLQFATNGN